MKRDPDYLQFRPYRAIVAPPKKRAAPVPVGRSHRGGFSLRAPRQPRPRSRLLYATFAVMVIGLGLLWRSDFVGLPHFLAKYGGTAWWALLVFLCCGFTLPRARTRVVALLAGTFSFGIEFSQFYHMPWIDHLRDWRIGALVLGSTFSWADLPAYALGILVGTALESALRKPDV